MDTLKLAEDFNETFKSLIKEDKKVRAEVALKLAKRIEKIWPIVNAMKENKVYFKHPDIDVKTVHGIIVGKDYRNHSYIYVCKEMGVVHKVDIHDDEVTEGVMYLNEFLQAANLDFAVGGIAETENSPTKIIDEIQQRIQNAKIILQRLS